MQDKIMDMLDAWDENAENFRGTVPDDKKMELLARMRATAAEIEKLTRCALRSIPHPVDNHDRTACVLLRGKSPILVLDAGAVDKIGALCTMADSMTIAVGEDASDIQMCFMVSDVWKEWRMENSPFPRKK